MDQYNTHSGPLVNTQTQTHRAKPCREIFLLYQFRTMRIKIIDTEINLVFFTMCFLHQRRHTIQSVTQTHADNLTHILFVLLRHCVKTTLKTHLCFHVRCVCVTHFTEMYCGLLQTISESDSDPRGCAHKLSLREVLCSDLREYNPLCREANFLRILTKSTAGVLWKSKLF